MRLSEVAIGVVIVGCAAGCADHSNRQDIHRLLAHAAYVHASLEYPPVSSERENWEARQSLRGPIDSLGRAIAEHPVEHDGRGRYLLKRLRGYHGACVDRVEQEYQRNRWEIAFRSATTSREYGLTIAAEANARLADQRWEKALTQWIDQYDLLAAAARVCVASTVLDDRLQAQLSLEDKDSEWRRNVYESGVAADSVVRSELRREQ